MKGEMNLFAVATPGLEEITHGELKGLGLLGKREKGGVAFRGSLEDLYRANLWLRTAHRILVRVATFRASTWRELERGLDRVEWSRFYPGGIPRVRVVSYRSRLYHERAVSERALEAVDRKVSPGRSRGKHPSTLHLRIVEDTVTVSIDSSGEHLHKRGYRQVQGQAPLRETLAAAMLLACGWPGNGPLLDPFCGSGTIAIEGALLALGWAPGQWRSFAFQEWSDFDASLWERLLEEAAPEPAASPPPIMASDMKAAMVNVARENARKAGVEECIEWDCRPFSFMPSLPEKGWLVTNPPYGRRLGTHRETQALYASLGRLIREKLPRWRIALLVPPRHLGSLAMTFRKLGPISNGGLKVWLVVRE